MRLFQKSNFKTRNFTVLTKINLVKNNHSIFGKISRFFDDIELYAVNTELQERILEFAPFQNTGEYY